MVPVIIIAVVFTGLAATLFWAAPRGKLAPVSKLLFSQKKGTSATINISIGLVMVVFGIVVPIVFLVGNHDDAKSAGLGNIKLTASETTGRNLFGEHCAFCHTLDAASAVGKTGPNLDQLQPPYPVIIAALENGCVANPLPGEYNCGLGQGNMPADIVQGQDAEDVAKFVSAVAGKT